MRNTLKHLTLLTRMKDDGLLPTLTGSFSEDAIAQACGQVETLQLQERLHIRKTKRIQEELVRVPDFAALYGTLCRQEIGDEEIASALESADGYGERLTAYSQEQVLAVMKLELLPSLRFEYLKYYFPFVMRRHVDRWRHFNYRNGCTSERQSGYRKNWFGCRTLQRSMVRCAGRRLAMKKLLQP